MLNEIARSAEAPVADQGQCADAEDAVSLESNEAGDGVGAAVVRDGGGDTVAANKEELVPKTSGVEKLECSACGDRQVSERIAHGSSRGFKAEQALLDGNVTQSGIDSDAAKEDLVAVSFCEVKGRATTEQTG